MSAEARPLLSSAKAWIALVGLTAILTGLFEAIHLSAALLLGAMAAGMILSGYGSRLQPPLLAIVAAQAIVGCLVVRALAPSIFQAMTRDWPVFIVAVGSVLLIACLLGQLLTRWQVLPGTTALWGSFPGAATVMVFMAEAYGADMRLVAFMQYLRVAMVALVASAVARLWALPTTQAVGTDWFAPPPLAPFAATMAIAVSGVLLGRLFRLPVAPMMGPLLVGLLAQNGLGIRIELPPLLLAAAYTIVGWNIGGRFTRDILRYAFRALPRLVLAILALIALSGCLAAGLVVFAHIDPMTAYLATSPGGADSVAIIAASTKVDVSFVMALQVMRFVIVLLFGPRLARFFADRAGRPAVDAVI
jgi:uncharacterized protein